LILTDLPPSQADAIWYGMRAWIEGGDKDAKRGGWHWEPTNMTDPARAERLWLAMALAPLWVVSVGCAAEVAHPAPVAANLPATRIARQRATGQRAPRTIQLFSPWTVGADCRIDPRGHVAIDAPAVRALAKKS
jgi:hypothetical protein